MRGSVALAALAICALTARIAAADGEPAPQPLALRLDRFIKGSCRVASLQGALIYIGGERKLTVLTATNPSQPGDLAGCAAEEGIRDLVIDQANAVALTDRASVRVFDLSRPVSPVARGMCALPGEGMRLAVSGAKGYAAIRKSDARGALAELDLIDPAKPRLLRVADLPRAARGVALAGRFALVACEDEGLAIVDVEADELKGTGKVGTRGPALAVAAQGSRAYVAEGDAFEVFDLADPERPRAIGSVAIKGAAQDVAISGATACVAVGSEGINLVDVSAPAHPRVSARFVTPFPCPRAAIQPGLIGAATEGGLTLIRAPLWTPR